MEAALKEKYMPQLNVYRNVIQTMLDVDVRKIRTAIISFSQKDADGNMLKGKEIRVRYTEISSL